MRWHPPNRRVTRTVAAAAGQAIAAGAVFGLCYHWLDRPRSGVDQVADHLLRATGITAGIWAYFGLIVGLLVGIRTPGPLLAHRAQGVTLHRQLNLGVLLLIGAHLLAFVLATPGGSVLVALVPQSAQITPLGYTAGVLAFYLALLLGPSYYLRRRIGRRAWLVAHQFAAVTYALALWHTLALGADVRIDGRPRQLLWLLQLPLLGLFGLRLYRPLRVADRLDAERRPERYALGQHAVLRIGVVLGVCLAGAGVLYVTLAAASPGLRGPGGR